MASLSVLIPIATTWPTAIDLAARDTIIDALSTAKIGKCTGAGGGMGEMDFSFDVSDLAVSTASIHAIMKTLMPEALYRVHTSE